jgi:hypothetical protein
LILGWPGSPNQRQFERSRELNFAGSMGFTPRLRAGLQRITSARRDGAARWSGARKKCQSERRESRSSGTTGVEDWTEPGRGHPFAEGAKDAICFCRHSMTRGGSPLDFARGDNLILGWPGSPNQRQFEPFDELRVENRPWSRTEPSQVHPSTPFRVIANHLRSG